MHVVYVDLHNRKSEHMLHEKARAVSRTFTLTRQTRESCRSGQHMHSTLAVAHYLDEALFQPLHNPTRRCRTSGYSVGQHAQPQVSNNEHLQGIRHREGSIVVLPTALYLRILLLDSCRLSPRSFSRSRPRPLSLLSPLRSLRLRLRLWLRLRLRLDSFAADLLHNSGLLAIAEIDRYFLTGQRHWGSERVMGAFALKLGARPNVKSSLSLVYPRQINMMQCRTTNQQMQLLSVAGVEATSCQTGTTKVAETRGIGITRTTCATENRVDSMCGIQSTLTKQTFRKQLSLSCVADTTSLHNECYFTQ